MIYFLMLCTFMSAGESCTDFLRYKTLDACVTEANRRKPTEKHNEIYKCEGRREKK